MRYHNLELDMILRGIVMTRGENGATISEMRTDYYDITGEQWPLYHYRTQRIVKYLMEIDGFLMHKHENGLCIWYIDDLGNNVSGQDSNNNVITIESTEHNVTASEKSQPVHSNSYADMPRRRMVTSSFVKDNAHGVSTTSTTSVILPINCESIDNGNHKRHLSKDSQMEHSPEKRPKMFPLSELALNEENLGIHNRESGAHLMVKKTTSTEIEKSISIPNDLINGSIATNDYIAPIKDSEGQQLEKDFAQRCLITKKHNFIRVDSEESTMSLDDHLFPSTVGVIGDDFMRALISFELFGGDFTDKIDKRFQYCISGQTVRDAYHLVLDKQNHFRQNYRYLLVNVGAIDIMLERDFVDIIAEYARLIRAILTIGLQPIITTIPNIVINSNNKNHKIIYQTLLLFNQFLLNTWKDGYLLLDLHLCLSERNRRFPSAYYHSAPKTISKYQQKLQLWRWADYGRKKILDNIHAFMQTIPEV